MADRYLLESGAPDGYLLEDSSGVLLLEDMAPFTTFSGLAANFSGNYEQPAIRAFEVPNTLVNILSNTPPDTTTVLRGPLFSNNKKSVSEVYQVSIPNLLETTLAQSAPVSAPFVNELLPTVQKLFNVQVNVFPNLLLTTLVDQYIITGYPETYPVHRPNHLSRVTEYPNLLVTTLATTQNPFVNARALLQAPQHVKRIYIADAFSAFPLLHTLAGVSGSASITEQADTLNAIGTTTIVGTSSTTNNNDTVSASGTTTVTGTSSTTNNDDTVSASGSVGSAVTGTASITEQADTSNASGSPTIVGTSSTNNNNDTVSASGTTTIVGSSSTTNNNDTCSASGFVGNPPTVTTYLPLTGAGK